MHGANHKCIQSFNGKISGKQSSGRPRRRWEENIEMDLRAVDCDDGDWIDLAEDRV